MSDKEFLYGSKDVEGSFLSGTERSPLRIALFLNELEQLWFMFPDWRFGQLVVNVFGEDPFNIEDDVARELLQMFIDESKKMS